ncbi:MAG: formylglycine-generating enzyme family protein, partial [Nitrospinales bacterium]
LGLLEKLKRHGLYDMLGNVYEWTLDWYGPYETVTLQANPKGPPEGKEKVVRGGSWNSPPHFLRPSDRVGKWPDFRFSDVGFRCVVPLS